MLNQMYTNEIATKLDIRVSLVIHHLKKLEELNLLEISNKKIRKKGEQHRFFKINSDIFITLDKTKEEVKEKGILNRIFKSGVKFTIIGIITFSVFMITDFKRFLYPDEFAFDLPVLVIPLIVLIIGLIIERILLRGKKVGKINPTSLRI